MSQQNSYDNGPFDPMGQPNPYQGPGFSGDSGRPAKGKKSKSKDKTKTTRRVVSTQRKLFLGFAVVVGLLTVLVATSANKGTYIVRTTDAIGALQSIDQSHLETFAVDDAAVEPTAWSGPDARKLMTEVLAAIASKRTSLPIGAHQQLRPELFSTQIETSSPLSPDERLVSISARASAAIVGSLKPGDRVDVYAATTAGLAGLLGSDVEVVAVSITADQLDSASQQQVTQKDKQLSDLVPGNPIPGTYVLRVNAADVARFVAADAGGKVYLSLRGADAGVTPVTTTDIAATLCSGANASNAACQRR